MDVDDSDLSIVLTQGTGDNYRIIGMTGRPLTISELKLPRVEQLLVVALYGLKHFARVTQHIPVAIVLPSPVES